MEVTRRRILAALMGIPFVKKAALATPFWSPLPKLPDFVIKSLRSPKKELDISETFDQSVGPGCTRNPTLDDPIVYREWNIHKWTGWKGNRSVASKCHEEDCALRKAGCEGCGKPILEGQIICEYANSNQLWHFDCKPQSQRVYGQWLAHHGNPKFPGGMRYVYSGAPGTRDAYQKGTTFNIGIQREQPEITYWTPKEIRDKSREDALVVLKKLIDGYEDGILPWPSFWEKRDAATN